MEGVEFAAELFLARAADLPKWLLGATLLRLTIGYFQKLLRLEGEGGLDLIYLIGVVLLAGSARLSPVAKALSRQR